MEYKLTLSVFRFDAKTDYLPFYKKVVLSVDGESTVSDLLQIIKDDEKEFAYPKGKNAAIKINDLSLFTNIKINEIVKNFGKELKLEPISFKRAVKDLTINSDDFLEKFDLLDAFVDSSDKRTYDKFIREFYASDVLKYNEEYIGDALFAFAYEMIEKYPERKDQILETLTDNENGIWLHVDISSKLYPSDTSLQEKVEKLKGEIIREIPLCSPFVEKLSKSNNAL
jgi:succinate dehydrogenase/fumarate reductase-like Fe-S protein